MKALVSVGLLGCLALGCSSDGGGGGGGNPSGDPTDCYATGQLSGGVEHRFGESPACSGTDTSAAIISFRGQGASTFTQGSVGITFHFDPAPAPDQTGPASISGVTVRETGPKPADQSQLAESFEWEFPAGACILDIQSTALDSAFAWLWFFAEGSCSGSAEAVAPNTKAPVSLSGLAMNSFVSLSD